jgi:hypothetical protein
MNKRGDNLSVAPEEYLAVFGTNEHGKRILAELIRLYYDVDVFDPTTPHNTSYNAGKRIPIAYILHKMSIAQNPTGEEITLEE